MKDFFEKLMTDEESRQNYTVKEILVYGVVVPMALILIMGIAGWMDTISM